MKSIHAETLYTGKAVVENAYVVFNGAKIVGVSKAKKGDVVGECAVVTPAFVDPHSHIGMERAGEPGDEGEANEHMDAVAPLPDALDSVQMDDPSFREAAEAGVLYSCIVPGSGNIIGGKSAVVRHYAKNSTDALVARAGIKAAFGHNPRSTTDWKGDRPSTRMGAIAILRKKLLDVQQKMDKQRKARGKKKDDVEFDAEEAVLREVLAGKERLRCHVHKIDDIASLLRVVDEFKLRITIEHACDVHEPEIWQAAKKRGIPVTFGPADAFAYKVELKHENWRNIKHLVDSGVEYGLMTDHPVVLSRTLFLQTRWFTRCGLSKQQAIELVSRRNAKLLGIDDRLGTLDRGKWASFTCWNGDPFDVTRYPVAAYGEGEIVFAE